MSELDESIIDGLSYPLVVLDQRLRIVRSNRRFREVFRQTPADGVNSPLGEVFGDTRLDSIVRREMAAERAMGEAEFSCRIGDTQERHFLLTISKVKPSSAHQHVLITFEEVTEWRRRQILVMEASRLASIGEMVAGVAHEINNPMAAIMGFSQLVLGRDLDSVTRTDLEKILAEAKRASRIITDLQSFARGHALKRRYLNVVDLMKRVLGLNACKLSTANLEVITMFGSDEAMVLGDRSELERAFLSVLTNAVEFAAGGKGGGRLTVELTSVEGGVRIVFADDGPGIRREDLPKIFDPFFTTKGVGKGSGLGLSLSYGVVRAHGGTISAESELGQGATFTIDLPTFNRSQSLLEAMEPASQRPRFGDWSGR